MSSSVKLNASDTVASTKIVYGMVLMFLFTLFLQVIAWIYTYCKIYVDLYGSFWTSLEYLAITGVTWPIYMYLAIILSDRAFSSFGRLYSRALSICSPREIENLKSQRAQQNDLDPKIFPGLQPGDLFKEKANEIRL
ncbi:unnamed protein product [Blepharisma stoltei]|uniref:P-type ATPase C-terminal domain-containing protein n=1 Tax=Blepharisma stoltei TaxID=1481888 RepID=A0AAU9IXE2_9CILI|nr:unnamed protein product [Blepharisma stoltei]